MKSRKERIRSRFQLETLEGRIALSSIGGDGADDAIHGHRHQGGHAADIQMQHRGQNDPADHDLNDDRDGVNRGPGQNDPVDHDANDDHGGRRGGRR